MGEKNYTIYFIRRKCLIDEAIQHLKEGKSLRMVHFQNNSRCQVISLKLGRSFYSVCDRWNNKIKIWLLQYFNKTLNLEIRPVLANAVADNFESIEAIDWTFLTYIP